MTGRLTFHEKNGKFGVAGMNAKNESEKVYACICKLKDYEDTGLSPAEVQQLVQDVSADKLNELEKAAEALGYNNAKIDYKDVSLNRARVSINGEDIGIYDFDRHTFVD